MCRFIAYLGPEILLEDVLVSPVNSIVMQSLHARESAIPTNGDGFGVGWYNPSIGVTPGLFTSVFPAWNDQNLRHITQKIKSPVFFAHVRAASAGGVTHFNCHPFVYQNWMLMQNGGIDNFIEVKRHIRHLLDDEIYHWVKGDTDSEHIFGLFLQLAKGKNISNIFVAAEVLEETLQVIADVLKRYKVSGPSFYNLCLTDGQRMIASRYCTDTHTEPRSLHFSQGLEFKKRDRHYHMCQDKKENNRCVLITSEKLTNFNGEWESVPPSHLLIVDHPFSISLQPLSR